MKGKWYTVELDDNFYEGMTGRLIYETEKTRVLEFKLNEKLGGTQRVQFFKEQVRFDGEY